MAASSVTTSSVRRGAAMTNRMCGALSACFSCECLHPVGSHLYTVSGTSPRSEGVTMHGTSMCGVFVCMFSYSHFPKWIRLAQRKMKKYRTFVCFQHIYCIGLTGLSRGTVLVIDLYKLLGLWSLSRSWEETKALCAMNIINKPKLIRRGCHDDRLYQNVWQWKIYFICKIRRGSNQTLAPKSNSSNSCSKFHWSNKVVVFKYVSEQSKHLWLEW